MQKYKEINGNDYVKNSRTTINETMQSIQSMNSGTAFPTNNLFEGMKCYRTDLKKTYTLTDVENNTWVEDAHATLSDEATHAASATKLQTARSLNLGGAVTADAATFDGTANATINVKTLDATKLKGTASVSTTGNAATATKVVATAAAGASANIAEATMASSGSARIRVSGETNAGELALETADDGSEPIVARQYTGIYTTPVRTAKILDESGNTSFPGTVVAPKFTGALNGNAATATKLQTARTLSLTGKAAGSATFDGSSNAAINVTSVNADTASKLSTARKINITGNATGSAGFDGSGDVSINVTVNSATNADKVDDVHAASLFYDKGDWDADNWATMGAYQTNGTPPSSDWYGWGQVISSSTDYARFQLYASDNYAGNGRLYYRTGWSNTKHQWNTILDSENYNSFAPTKTGGGASGTWGINISGNAASATKAVNDGNGANIASTYVKKAGDTTTGKITFESTNLNALPEVKKTSDDNMSGIRFSSKTQFLGAVGKRLSNGEDLLNLRSDNTSTDVVLDSRNYNNYAPTKTGTGASGTWGINISGNAASATNADKVDGYHASDLLGKIYPVGSIYMSMSATNPATLFGIGTWKRISQGRMLLGADDSTYKAGATGGEATHTLTANEMPAHSHGISTSGDHSHYFYGSNNNNGPLTEGDGLDTEANAHYTHNERYTTSSAGAHTHTISNSGGGAAHNNMSPYLVCYIWQRTA